MVLILIIKAFYFMLPAYFANMAPVIVKNLFKSIAAPIDLNKKFNDKSILGKNKTWRGLIFGILFAIIISFFQFLLFKNNFLLGISLMDYSNWLLFGFLIGSGAIIGDLIESLFKRRLNYKPGQPFAPFDQIDFILGALIFIYPIVKLSISLIITIITLTFILHILVNHLAFYLKLRSEKW